MMLKQDVISPGVRVVRITDEAAFAALKTGWNRIAALSGMPSVFLRHEWFDAAWQWRRQDAKLFILCIYRDEMLIGICPLISRHARHARMQVRLLEFLTVPDTQACDVLSAPEDASAVVEALSMALFACRNEWDVLQLSYLQPGTASHGVLPGAFLARGLKNRMAQAGDNPFIDLQTGWEAFYATRGRRLKKSNNLVANRIKKAGELEIEWLHRDADAEKIGQTLAAAVEISARSWKETTGNTLENPAPGAFIKRLTDLAHAEGWLSIWLLRLGGKPVAMEYQLAYQGSVHALRADYDNEYRDFSPGSYLNWKLLEQTFSNGFQRYCMGPGDNPYKLRWTETALPLSRLTAYSTSWRGKLAALYDLRLAPVARSAAARLDRLKPKKEEESEA